MAKLKLKKDRVRRLHLLVVAGVVASVASATIAFSAASPVNSNHKAADRAAARKADQNAQQAKAQAAAQAKMSANQAFNACKQNILVVAHTGTNGEGSHSSLDVDTTQWINHEIAQGHNRIELDEQVSSDGQGFAFHDRTLNAETKNGSGVVHTRPIKYLNGLKSRHGDGFANANDLIRILKQNPKVDFQHEFKDYDNQWTPQFLAAWYAQFSAAGVMNQIHVSSSSPRVLSWFHANHPEVHDLQLIGFNNYLPDLDTAVSVGATQVNASGAALDKYQGHPNYLAAARARGLKTSIRSNPNGNGDNGNVWLKAINYGVDQIVTQGPTKAEVCNAVRKAAS